MDKFKHYLNVLLLITLAVAIVYWYLSRHDETIMPALNTQGSLIPVEPTPITDVYVIAFDMNKKGKVSADDIVAGSAPFLGFTEPKIGTETQVSRVESEVMDGVNLLKYLDTDKNGIVDSTDHFYNNIEMMTFIRGGKHFRIFPIEQSGVKAISINPQFLDHPEVARREAPRIIGYVLIADGTRRNLWMVGVPAKNFQPE